MKISDYFSKIYIINLPERKDRREELEEMFKNLGIDSSRFEYFPAVRPTEAAGFRTIGARGCFMSHLSILEKAKKDGLSSVLIIEDDLDIDKNFTSIEKKLTQELCKQPWDIVYLGHPLELKNMSTDHFIRYSDEIILAHFLGFDKKAIDALVPFLQGLLKEPPGSPNGGPMDVDGAYSTFRSRHPEMVTLVATPSLGGQRSSRSDITSPKWYDRGIFRYISSYLRKLKQYFKSY